MSQIWNFNNGEDVAKIKEIISFRHPSNMTSWPDDYTIKLDGEVHNQTALVLKQCGAKRID